MKTLKEKLRQNKAITLVSLSVTIVVLIILASVSIPMIVGEQGIIKQSQKQKANIESKENINDKTINSLESELNEKREDILADISKGTNYITLSNVHIDEGNVNAYYYSIKKSTDSTYENFGTSNAYESVTAGNLIHNTEYKVKITAKYNNTVVKEIIKTVHTDELLCASLNMKIEDNGLDYNNGTWINKNVKVSLTDSTNNSYYATADSAQKIDNTQGETVINTSGVTKIKVVATDGTNTIDNDYIIKIDKEIPTPGKLTMKKGDANGENYISGTWANQNVYVALDNSKDMFSGIRSAKYSINNRTPLTEAFTLKNEEICSIVVTVEDYAGNVSTSEPYEVKIDKTNPEDRVFLSDQELLPNGTGNTGDYQEYIIPETGNYKISAYGAAGSNGSTSTTYGTSQGGKGALVYGDFELKQGDKLIMLVGQKGQLTGTQTSTSDTTAGGGGGGTFVTKVDSASTYKLTARNNELVTPLLVAAGGNAGNDVVYQKTIKNGADGIWTNGTSNTGFTKFLTSPNGGNYSRGGLTAIGGYGGGYGSDDSNGYAGGWQLGTSQNVGAYSYISEVAKRTGGETGNNDGDGKVTITLDSEAERGVIKYIILASDNLSGIDFSKSKYIIDTSPELKGNDQTKWSSGTALTGEETKGTYTPENDGRYYVHVLVVDNAGNFVEKISEEKLVDTTPPTIGNMIMKKVDANGVDYQSGTWSDQNIYVALGNCEDNIGIDNVTYSIDGGESLTEPTILTKDGEYSIIVTAEDIAGNITTSEPYEVKIDRRAPVGLLQSENTFLPTGTGATGSYQEYTVKNSGICSISAYGAAGSNGSTSTTYGTSQGGKGALVYGDFELNQGDKLIMLVGQKGQLTGTQTSTSDTTAGGGGGGTFVTKVDSTSTYKLTAKNNELVTPLLVAAGGNAGNDVVYQKTIKNGADGIWTNGTSSTGFTKFLTSPNGGSYSRGGLTAIGGYGGGYGSDDSNGYAGGWKLGTTSNTAAYSYISSTAANSGGETANNKDDGKIIIVANDSIIKAYVEGNVIHYTMSMRDDLSGINLANSKYIIDMSPELKGTNLSNWTGAQRFNSSNIEGTYTIIGEGTYYIHVLAVDNVGNAEESIEKVYYDNSKPTLKITSSGNADQYPDILTVTAEDAGSPIQYIELPDGTKIAGDGVSKKITTTFNATKNGPLTFKTADESGKETTEVYQEKNVINFETEWTTTEANTTITVPVTGTVDVYIDYGDGTAENVKVAKSTHTYANPGVYTMKISGSCTAFNCSGNASAYQYITGLKKWGCLSNSDYHFGGSSAYVNGSSWNGCKNMTGNIPVPHAKSFQKLTSCSEMFYYCTGLNGNIPEELFMNGSNIEYFEKTFAGCNNLTGTIPANLFVNCPNVKSFYSTFSNCSGLTGNIPAGLFSKCLNVTNFYSTFSNCKNLNGNIPEVLFTNCPKATNLYGTFNGCSGLTGSIPEKLFANCSEITTFNSTFNGCSNLTGNIPKNLFINCSKVNSFDSTFLNCSNLTGSIPGELFTNSPKVTTFNNTFYYCSKLTGSIPEELFANCLEVTNFSYTFSYCSNLTGNIPERLFANCLKVTNLGGTFNSCRGLTGSIPERLFENCSNVTNLGSTFNSCNGLTGSIPERLFENCSNVTNFDYTFSSCNGLTGSIPENLFANCQNATSFLSTFSYCNNLTGSIPERLFANCPAVTRFYSTFNSCTGLDGTISSTMFDNNTAVTNFYNTFYGCNNLTGTAPNLWDRTNVTSYSGCFRNCTKISNYSLIPTNWK